MRSLNQMKSFIEWHVFGVCQSFGERMGIASGKIRLWFIYITFLTLGSPIIIYMILAFWINIQKYFWLKKRDPLKWY